jgi:hypothetical protein
VNADDRLPLDSLGRVESGIGVGEGATVPMFVRSRPSRTRWTTSPTAHDPPRRRQRPPGQAACRLRLGRPGDGHQYPAASNQSRRPLPDVSANHVEHQIDAVGVFQRVVLKVDELLRAEAERRLTVGGTSGADDVRASSRWQQDDADDGGVEEDGDREADAELPCPRRPGGVIPPRAVRVDAAVIVRSLDLVGSKPVLEQAVAAAKTSTPPRSSTGSAAAGDVTGGGVRTRLLLSGSAGHRL